MDFTATHRQRGEEVCKINTDTSMQGISKTPENINVYETSEMPYPKIYLLHSLVGFIWLAALYILIKTDTFAMIFTKTESVVYYSG
jgi:hypothetical protein